LSVASFECITRSKISKAELFDRSLSIEAHLGSMAKSREKAVRGVTAGLISLGEEVTWRAWHFGIPIHMTSRITEMVSPDYFVDEQVKGPFRRFRHIHEFLDDGEETVMIDRIKFAALPWSGRQDCRTAFPCSIPSGSHRNS
jgi:ligand-binding SRPBCC domain-containing protein